MRSARRAVALAVWGSFSIGLYAVGKLLGLRAMRSFWMQRWGRGCLRAIGGDLRVIGTPPQAPYLLVCNHLSYVDILVLAAALPRTHFVSKAEVRDWPVLGPMAALGETLFLRRERHRDLPETVAQIRGWLERGEGVVFFPEGTSSGGSDLLPFRASLFAAVARLDIGVSCASLRYLGRPQDPAPSESVCWWRDMEFGSHARALLRLRGLHG